ncbi:MAG: ATP-binding protein [Candidatus Beckwithbacteria bacterium]|nr:ATP-binding protein [Patescibacteria group bacterium]
MYPRLLKPVKGKSFFLFGPRGTGKTTWVKARFPNAIFFDLLDSKTYTELLARPERLEQYLPPDYTDFVIIDEIQRVPDLLNEVHRLMESRKIKFVLTGSSARKLRRGGHNLLAGRALTYRMYPLTTYEMGGDFDLAKAVLGGMLPLAQVDHYQKYLNSYIKTYLEQEVLQEGLTRNLAAFTRFLETASFSQGQMLNMASVAREAEIERTTVMGYFEILQDLLIGYLLPVFTKRAKRRLVSHPKFYFFDTGLYQIIRPRGPYDTDFEVGGISLETLVFQELMAMNDLLNLDYKLYYYRTATGVEVDFVMYGKRGIMAIEVKSSDKFQSKMISGLKKFSLDYPEAKLFLFYGGKRKMYVDGVTVLPVEWACRTIGKW